MVDLAVIAQAVVAGKAAAAALVTEALSEGIDVEKILSEAIEVALEEVGEKFKRHEIYLPEVLLAKRAVQGCMAALGGAVTAELEARVKGHFDRMQSQCATCHPLQLWNGADRGGRGTERA